ncbi:unnamed protein product, partial [Didymodactylos carnosus]
VHALRTLVSSKSRRGNLTDDLSQRRIAELKFRELLTDPLTDQNLNFFKNYFNEDISVKQFDVTQFCRLFQITPVLVCSNCSHMNCTNEFCHRRTLKKIEQETYLNANPEHEHYLDIHLYFTSLASNETSRIDMYTNLKTKTRIGRPNWKLLFSKLKVEQNNRGTRVFFCGNKTMGQAVQQQCQEQNFLFRSEPFDK